MMHKRQHSPEFQLEIVRLVTPEEKRPAQVCHEHGWPRACCRVGARSTRNVEKLHPGPRQN
ncbi:hypothetical protein [Ktedonospora formicarum]|uniref:hypothetical protein n=1 Tax=Ktedonospora formicarum TaxID=2778364 RepID=UPI001C687769|nr:hypothetical protein [Ktedonospora formicarum]